MWILINNKPVNIFEINSISEIRKVESGILPRENYPYFRFDIDKTIASKRYKTYEEAEEIRNNLLILINQSVSHLPKIEI